MRKLIVSSLIALSLTSCAPAYAGDGGDDCDHFNGRLVITWPESPAEVIQPAVMFDFSDDHRFTEFDVNGVEYRVQDPNVTGHVDFEQCTFHLTFNGDPIFHDGFERSGDCT